MNRSGSKSDKDTGLTIIPPIVPTASERGPLQPTPLEKYAQFRGFIKLVDER